MQTVNYIGTSQVRIVTAAQFVAAGIAGQATAQWDPTNSYQQVVSDAAGVFLIAQGDFVLDGGITFAELIDALSVGTLLADLTAPPQVAAGTTFRRMANASLLYVEIDGVARKITAGQAKPFFGGGSDMPRAIAGADTLVPATDNYLSSTSASAFNFTLPNIPAASHPIGPYRFIQAAAGQVTFIAGASALVSTTGAGRTKARAAYSVVDIIPLFDFSGTTVYTVAGDTQNS